MTSWYVRAVETINEVTRDLPNEMPLKERMSIVDAAYPFGPREQWPYKAWLKARRNYLARHGYRVDLPLLSPLERQKQRAKQ